MWIFRMVVLLIVHTGIHLTGWIDWGSGAAAKPSSPLEERAQLVAGANEVRPPPERESLRPFWRSSPGSTTSFAASSYQESSGDGFHFERFIVSPINLPPQQVVVGDVSGDRRNDIVVVQNDWSVNNDPKVRVEIHAQNADGTLAPPIDYEILADGVSGTLELADLDGDGLLEILVAAGNKLTIFRKAMVGYSHTSFLGIAAASSLAVIDADGDGAQDIVAQSWSHGADIYLGNGRGGVGSVLHMDTPAMGYNTLETSDFTADGFADLVMTNGQGWEKVWIYPFTPYGLAAPISVDLTSVTANTISGMTVADIDRDGRPDLVVADEGDDIAPKGIHIMYRGTENQFRDKEFLEFTGPDERPGAVRVADVDGNGYPDIITMINSNDEMAYFLQGPSGFASPVIQKTDDDPSTNNIYLDNSFVIADVNSDRCPDVVLAEQSSSLRTFYGRSCQVPEPRTGGPSAPGRL